MWGAGAGRPKETINRVACSTRRQANFNGRNLLITPCEPWLQSAMAACCRPILFAGSVRLRGWFTMAGKMSYHIFGVGEAEARHMASILGRASGGDIKTFAYNCPARRERTHQKVTAAGLINKHLRLIAALNARPPPFLLFFWFFSSSVACPIRCGLSCLVHAPLQLKCESQFCRTRVFGRHEFSPLFILKVLRSRKGFHSRASVWDDWTGVQTLL